MPDLSPELQAVIDSLKAHERRRAWHLYDMAEPRRRRPFRRYFQLRLEFPCVSSNYRSMRFLLVLPGLIVDYRENVEDFATLFVASGCRIFIFNPFQVNKECEGLHGRAIVAAVRETNERARW